MKLSPEEISQKMSGVPQWTLEDKTIVRRYKFTSFVASVEFVNEVAELAEERNHHPFISIDYHFVTLKLTSWHAGGLTEDDFSEALACDRVYQRYILPKQP